MSAIVIEACLRVSLNKLMNEYIPIIKNTKLFGGISEDEITAMLKCLQAEKKSYKKDAYILRTGDRSEAIGMVLSGTALILQDDIWGNRNIIAKVGPGQTFASSFACAPGALMNADVIAETKAEIMFLNVQRILTTCSSACAHHSHIIRNLLGELAEKNIISNEKLSHMGQRSTRSKLMSYFSSEAKKNGNCEFDIPFSRQQLADYLAVERSGLSLELGKMRDEGILEFHKNHFKLNEELVAEDFGF